MKKVLLTLLGIFLILAAAGGIWFKFNWHRLPGIIASIKNPTGPNQEVIWQDGPTTRTLDKPNVIVILVDDLGFNEVSSYGGGMADGRVKTPHIDQLAGDGVLCTNGYSATAVCSPSRASLLTGRYSTRFGHEFTPVAGMGKFLASQHKGYDPPFLFDPEVEDALPPKEEMGLPTSEITIAEMLKPEGYHNVHIGKWHLGGSNEYMPTNHGFDESLWLETGSLFLPEEHPDVVNAKLPFDNIDRFIWANLPFAVQHNESPRFNPDGYLTDYFTDHAVNVIEKNKNQPFFLYMAYWAVHTPLQALKSDYDQLDFIEDHKERVQAAMVLAVDRGVGKIRQALKENGIDDNTIIIFTSDNGAPGYIGLADVNKPYRGWKLSLFEGGVHVPYIVNYPDSIEGGQTYNGKISSVDILSTVGTLAGAQIPTDRKIDGIDMLPYLTGTLSGEPDRPIFSKTGSYSSVIEFGWKLQWDQTQNKKWLFNLNIDPTEQNNLIDSEETQASHLLNVLKSYHAVQANPIWKGATRAPIHIDKHGNEEKAKEDEYAYWQN